MIIVTFAGGFLLGAAALSAIGSTSQACYPLDRQIGIMYARAIDRLIDSPPSHL